MWDKFINGVKQLTEVGFSLIAFGVVLQVLFGDAFTAFAKFDVVANIINIDNGEINYNNNQFIFINDKPNIFGDLNIKENLTEI